MPYFFFSYARDDWDEGLSQFYGDLVKAVADRLGLEKHPAQAGFGRLLPGPADKAGFRDEASIDAGALWPAEVTDALRTCQIFVYLRSPRYFQRDYCGREWRVFYDRVQAWQKDHPGEPRPHLLLPILWQPPTDLADLPEVIARVPEQEAQIQHSHASFPDEYKQFGLQHLMQLRGTQAGSDYQKFKFALVDRLLAEATAVKLSASSIGPLITNVRSAFERPKVTLSAAADLPKAPTPGRLRAHFYYIAASPNEFLARATDVGRTALGCYGSTGEQEWFPYYPPPEEDVALIVQAVASDLKLHCHHVQLDNDLIQHIQEAQELNRIVVLLIDPWTLRLDRYATTLAACDRHEFYNYAVLVVWNKTDPETQQALPILEDRVKELFPTKLVLQAPHYYLFAIDSKDQLKSKLIEAIEGARGRILRLSQRVWQAGAGAKQTPAYASLPNLAVAGS